MLKPAIQAPFYFQIKVKKSGGGQIEGVASTPRLDRALDVVEPQAFASALQVYMQNPVLLFNHDYDRVAGHVDQSQVTDDGLFIKATVNDREIWDMVKQGDLRAFSIGYIPTRWRFEDQQGKDVRVIEELDLLEISIVSVPANQEALFSMAKSITAALQKLETKGVRGDVSGVQVSYDKKAKRYVVTRAGMEDDEKPPAKKKKPQQVASDQGEDTTEEKPAPEAPSGASEQGHADNDTPEGDDREGAASEGENSNQPDGEEPAASSDSGHEEEAVPEGEVKALKALAEAKGYRLVKVDEPDDERGGKSVDAVRRTDFKAFQGNTEKAVNVLTKQVGEIKELVEAINSRPVRKTAQAKRVRKFPDEDEKNVSPQQKSTNQLVHILTNPVKS